MQEAGFEIRDLESLREHYALTLRNWVRNLESQREEAVSLAGEGRYRVWRLYMAGSAVNFEAGRTQVHQLLGVRADRPLGRASRRVIRCCELHDAGRTGLCVPSRLGCGGPSRIGDCDGKTTDESSPSFAPRSPPASTFRHAG